MALIAFYGLQSETLNSLVLDLLPPLGHKYETISDGQDDSSISENITTFFLSEIVNVFRKHCGFNIPKVSI